MNLTYRFTKQEEQFLKEIADTYYMQKPLELVNNFIGENKNNCIKAFDEIYSILTNSKDYNHKLLEKRKENNEIKDIAQASKSIAGNSFSLLIIYIFLKNKEFGTINPDILITSKKSQMPNFDKVATINVDNETQKPDCDLVIYSLHKDNTLKKCIILSLKTSLRERAGQTYKWKLLMEIATSNNSIKDKYNISYNTNNMPLVCFATVNFYNEINNPQHKGMFKFFDKSFIAKNIKTDNFISNLSNLPDYVNKELL